MIKRRLGPVCLCLVLLTAGAWARQTTERPYFRGGLYLDWFGAKYEGTDLASRFSLRLKGEFLNRRGEGWNLLLDTRDRLRLGDEPANHVLLYDARLSFEREGSPWYLALGQMNLYDTAGIGQLLGGVVGFRLPSDILVGGYAGMESSVYIRRVSHDYSKFGVFARWLGSLGRRISLSFNQTHYSGEVERKYVYVGSLLPVNRSLVLYGNLEYELASQVRDADRLSRFFMNLRWDPLDLLDLLVHFSSGKGMDFHGYAVEQSKDPTLNDQNLERFYYSQQYGMRLSLKPKRGMRFYLERRESEQKDASVRNHTWRFGASGLNLFRSGISAYGNYALRRGEISESDSYYLSVTKDFGRISWNVRFANTFNAVRFDTRSGAPELIHLEDYKTISTHVFAPITRVLALSAEYEYHLQREADQHMVFVRLILRN